MPRVVAKKTEPVEKPGRVCLRCGKTYVKEDENFYTNNSLNNRYNDNRLPVCKSCVDSLYVQYISTYNDTYLATKRMCQMFDYYYSVDAVVNMLKKTDAVISFNQYIKALKSDANYTYDRTIEDEKAEMLKALAEAGANAVAVDSAMIANWGGGYTPAEYSVLEEKYTIWKSKYEIEDYAQENLVKMLCTTELDITRLRESGADPRTIMALQETYQKLLNTANLKPSANIVQHSDDAVTIGTMIEKFERERPISDPLPEYADPDGIHNLIKITVGGLGDMLNIVNPFVTLFKEFVSQFTVTPRIEESDDTDFDLEELIDSNNSSGFNSEIEDEDEYDGVNLDD